MTRTRGAQLFVIGSFLAVIFSAGLTQAMLEARRGEWPQVLALFKQKPTVANLRAYEQSLEDSSWAVKQLRPWMQYAQFVWLNEAGDKALAGRDGWLFYKPGVEYLTERPGAHPGTTTADDAVAAIVAFRDQLAVRDIQLLVMPAPDKESIYPERLTTRAVNLRGALSAETRGMLSRLQALGVEVVDLFKVFTDAKVPPAASPPPLYLAQDSHWSPAGVHLAAQAAASRLLERGWIRPGNMEYEARPAPVERVGDVVRMLQVLPLEQKTVPERIPCMQVVRRATGQPYQDNPGSEILVLGDSFLRIYETDEPGAAGFVAHLAKALKQPLASIINDGGASTLVRQELYRRPALLANKKVVLWEFVERDIRLGTEGWQLVPLPAQTGATAGRSP